MPVTKEWVVACDDDCGKTFHATGDTGEGGLDKFMPSGWLILVWRAKVGDRWEKRYFAGPTHVVRWLEQGKEVSEQS